MDASPNGLKKSIEVYFNISKIFLLYHYNAYDVILNRISSFYEKRIDTTED